MKYLLVACWLTLTACVFAAEPTAEVCVIVGAPGEADYAAGFGRAALAWEQAAKRGGAAYTVIGLAEDNKSPDREQLETWLNERNAVGPTTAWIVFLGHGTFDGREARLNLRGADVTAQELSGWLGKLKRPIVFVHGGSAAAPFIPALSGPGRIIISATRTGNEINYARFGERFATAIGDPAADVDHDGQTSVLEAFVTAAQQVQSFYAESGRLATEHALIDDNGDKQGTPAEWFRGTRLQKRAKDKAEPDGATAKLVALITTDAERAMTPPQRAERDRLEQELEALRARKGEIAEDEYYRRLEAIARQIGAIYSRGT
ncbi:MAG: hypothetical protein ABIZ04_06340 [Opitutus sp.]